MPLFRQVDSSHALTWIVGDDASPLHLNSFDSRVVHADSVVAGLSHDSQVKSREPRCFVFCNFSRDSQRSPRKLSAAFCAFVGRTNDLIDFVDIERFRYGHLACAPPSVLALCPSRRVASDKSTLRECLHGYRRSGPILELSEDA